MGHGGAAQDLRAAILRGALQDLTSGRFAVAEQSARQVIGSDPSDVEAMLVVGLALAAQGDALRAAPLLQRVAAARPTFVHPCRDLAQLPGGGHGIVAGQFRACRALAPDDCRLGFSYADFLLDSGNPAAAAAVLRQLIERNPGHAPAQNLFGMALLDLGDMAAAIGAFEAAATLAPTQAAAWVNLGMALKIEGRFDEAEAAHDRAVALAPNDPQIRLNRAVALLRAGRMTEAWPDYEQRMRLGSGSALPLERLLPDLATLDIAGRTILAWHEEGFGDTLQFCRYLPLLAARGARVIALVPRALFRIFATLAGVAEIIAAPASLPEYDYHVPFFSLPRAFGTTVGTIPTGIPYLAADPALIAQWAARLPSGGRKVGLVWAGQARPWLPGFASLDARRSMSPDLLRPLADVPGLTLISLQKGAAVTTMPLHDPMPLVADFADCAAIVANLDVVVSVDTSVVHLAGALGKPVLLLDRYDSCWRWLAGREDSPWYPSLRILRQTTCGEWEPVVARAAALLADSAGG